MTDTDRRVAAGVVAATAVALVARFLALGYRVAHWDEGRVGYWILRYAETGRYTYHPIVHGPFLFQVNRFVFDVAGASDATMRTVVALVALVARFMYPLVDPAAGTTVADAIVSTLPLNLMSIAAVILLPLVSGYFVLLYTSFSGSIESGEGY
nr:hypothetical protein [Halarchaeum acidiphilum]